MAPEFIAPIGKTGYEKDHPGRGFLGVMSGHEFPSRIPDLNLDKERPKWEAWQYVASVRYKELTGPIFARDPHTYQLQELQGTGFEGYYIGENIVAEEIKLGKHLLNSIHNFAIHEAPHYAEIDHTSEIDEHVLTAALCKGVINPKHEKRIRVFFNELFERYLEQAKGHAEEADALPGHRGLYNKFRNETYNSADKTKPVGEVIESKTILEDPLDIKAYRAISKIGQFGDPDARKLVHK
jgi:hypothetical protein